MERLAQSVAAFFVLLALVFTPAGAMAKVDWEVAGAVQLEQKPLDIAYSQERDVTFLLTDQAKILIYGEEGKLVGEIPIDPSVTDIAVSANGEALYLINGKRNTLQTLAISFIVDINVADSPFLGPASAKVAIAIFSDFQ